VVAGITDRRVIRSILTAVGLAPAPPAPAPGRPPPQPPETCFEAPILWRDGRLVLEIELPPHVVAALTVEFAPS